MWSVNVMWAILRHVGNFMVIRHLCGLWAVVEELGCSMVLGLLYICGLFYGIRSVVCYVG